MIVTLSFLLPGARPVSAVLSSPPRVPVLLCADKREGCMCIERSRCRVCAGGGGGGREGARGPTFDRVRLGQLRALLHQFLRQRVPCLLGREAQVDVRGGEVVGVELAPSASGSTLSVPLSFFHRAVRAAVRVRGRGGTGRTYVPWCVAR